ncbi:MAG: 4-alpha-glucanotransferase [Alphaproteobacteria bacterium]|nr:4-alpha-glucanotransferase [Alphaproteobacteria bacterium]
MTTEEIKDIDTALGKLADLSGIEYQSEPDRKVGMLKAMDILPEDFNYETTDKQEQEQNFALIKSLVKEKKDANFINIVHHAPVLRQNKVDTIEISLPDGIQKLKWNFYEDENPRKYYKGEIAFEDTEKVYSGETLVADLEPSGKKGENVHQIGDTVYRKYKFKFPFSVRLGYHNADFSYTDKKGVEHMQCTHLISAPEKCYDRLGIKDGNKTWGVPVQLYEQVSENNLGLGNYSDLAQLGYILGKNGAGLLGVNPVHANRADQPENASPYSPDSRMFFNYIYLDVTATEEFKRSPEIQAYYNSEKFQQKVQRNRRRAYVDYTTTQELVDDLLYRCYKEFKKNPDKEDANRFNVYCDSQDGILDMYATFRALNNYFSKQNPAPLDWRYWPDEYKDPKSEAFLEFVKKHQDEIGYYKYTQYQCTKQLEEVKDSCINSGMKIGLYMDMAVGASPKGFEAWYYSGLFIKGSAGATPDELSPTGQVWNVLGFNPAKLQEMGYEPYRRILETNMKYAGCIRIDHVLQLNRLYFHPDNGSRGTYVYYNSEELMAIVALESHRYKTMIIGEDLGRTTEDFRRQMEEYGILSYKVLPFEREGDCYNSMRRPEDYQQLSVCATSTHDTPTLVNQWNVQDIWQKKMLGFYDEAIINRMFGQYASQRESLNWMLEHYGCWQEVGGEKCPDAEHMANEIPPKYQQAVAAFMARSKSSIMLMPFSDIFGMSEMGNIPGTLDINMTLSDKKSIMEVNGNDGRFYPNWRKKMHIPVEHIEDVEMFKEIAAILNKYRPDGNDGRGKYYQFERQGINEASQLDFEKAKRLYNIIRYKEEYQMGQLLKNRYSPAYKNRLEDRRTAQQKLYTEALLAWQKFTKQDRAG